MSENIHLDLLNKAEKCAQPIDCSFELTCACNFYCKHCYIPQSEHNKKDTLCINISKNFIKELKQMGGMNITFTGGEPLLFSEDLFELMKYTRENGLISSLFTNASLINDSIVDKIVETNPIQVAITLYGLNEEEYILFTKNKAFLKVINGIQLLVKKNIRVKVRWQVTKLNYIKFPDYLKLVNDLGAKPSFCTNLGLDIDNTNKNEELVMNFEEYKKFVNILSKLEKFDLFLKRFKDIKEGKLEIKDNFCSTGRANVYIKSDGTVYPCATLYIPLGNIKNQSFRSIWSDDNIQLKKIREVNCKNIICGSCEDNLFCSICIGDFYIKNGDISKPDAFSCRKAHTMRKISEYIESVYL
jgi:AdoMet-dependent heme synthase